MPTAGIIQAKISLDYNLSTNFASQTHRSLNCNSIYSQFHCSWHQRTFRTMPLQNHYVSYHKGQSSHYASYQPYQQWASHNTATVDIPIGWAMGTAIPQYQQYQHAQQQRMYTSVAPRPQQRTLPLFPMRNHETNHTAGSSWLQSQALPLGSGGSGNVAASPAHSGDGESRHIRRSLGNSGRIGTSRQENSSESGPSLQLRLKPYSPRNSS